MKKAIRPLLISIVVVCSIYLGSKLIPTPATLNFNSERISGIYKLNEVLNYIQDAYVDTIAKEKLIEDGIESILSDLDPHSYYIPKEKFRDVTEGLEGNFEGIGIEFRIIDDTIMVISALKNGPSAVAGIKAGDRIVSVDDSLIAGTNLSNSKVMKLLKGPSRTKVSLGIYRPGENELEFEIERGQIPIYSVQCSYLLTPGIGYIKIDRFSKNTYSDFKAACDKMLDRGMQDIVVDLRGNPGGLLNQAIDMCDEFLPKDKVIVYTEGKSRPKKVYYAEEGGSLQALDLVVLLDQRSASASEVFAGAMQDNDRAMIVGRRSFGKGLVQEQVDWPDGSALRLTVARYYTPTGRSIQKPYKGVDDYHLETYGRMESGELQNADSIHLNDSLKFFTPGGRVVYGGGGIVPDQFIPMDTLLYNPFYNALYNTASILNFAFRYADKNRKALKSNYPDWKSFLDQFSFKDADFEAFLQYASDHGASRDTKMASILKSKIITELKAQCGRHLYGDMGFYPVLHQDDASVQEGIKILQ